MNGAGYTVHTVYYTVPVLKGLKCTAASAWARPSRQRKRADTVCKVKAFRELREDPRKRDTIGG